MSRKAAINNMCKQCLYDIKGEGNWVQQVTACSDYTCALYNVRPITTGSIPNVKSLVKYARKAEKAHLNDTKK